MNLVLRLLQRKLFHDKSTRSQASEAFAIWIVNIVELN
jgi:hypothetical protein